MNRTQVTGPAGRAAAVIRPVTAADEAVLSNFFAALSVESRYLRFFAPVTPSCGLLDLMAGKPAHVDAIVAVADGIIVGHAMAADRTTPENPRTSERTSGPGATDVGVVVADGWQRRGVGAALMRALIARAQARGVTTLAMDVLPGNRRVLAMVAGHWPDAAIGRSADGVDIRIPLTQRPALPPHRSRLVVKPLATAVGKPLAAVGR